MRYLFIGTTVTILLLTACGPAATTETVATLPRAATPTPAQTTFDSPLPPEVTPLPPTAEPSTPAKLEDTDKGRAVMGDAVIIYERSGGFAGIMQTYEIYADGRIVIRDGDTEIETRVSPSDVQTALIRIEELGFFDLPAPFGPVSAFADRIVHTITVKRDGRPVTVRTVDGATDEPAGLRDVIEVLNRLVAGESP